MSRKATLMRWLALFGSAWLLGLLFGGCARLPAGSPEATTPPAAGEVIIYAAASLTEAFGELGNRFRQRHPGTEAVFNFGGSQQLVQQLAQGAPADLFAPASYRQMETAIEAGLVVSDSVQLFARNRLVVIYPDDNPAGITSLQDLARPGLKLVLAAPEVPVGSYSLSFLEKASATIEYGPAYSSTVLANVVSYEQNVRAVLSKVALGEADAGIVYTSDLAADNAGRVGRIDIPDELNTIAEYPIAPVADAGQPALAQAFIDLVLSPEGQAILADYGFIPVAGR
ncbi:MAG TPA: molybdate ABC transporter substrate-binding protein [Caldilineaceae bacterium]|nr:molybdate ABC transporter substrate-binding protein [Caldilineaceae bacterium]